MGKFIAFGWLGYLDSKGEIIEESENYYIVSADGYFHKIALSKKLTDKLIKIFNTETERNEWIHDQHYQYDPR